MTINYHPKMKCVNFLSRDYKNYEADKTNYSNLKHVILKDFQVNESELQKRLYYEDFNKKKIWSEQSIKSILNSNVYDKIVSHKSKPSISILEDIKAINKSDYARSSDLPIISKKGTNSNSVVKDKTKNITLSNFYLNSKVADKRDKVRGLLSYVHKLDKDLS